MIFNKKSINKLLFKFIKNRCLQNQSITLLQERFKKMKFQSQNMIKKSTINLKLENHIYSYSSSDIKLKIQLFSNIAKLEKKLSNDEVKSKRISRKNSTTKPFKCSNCTHTYSSKAALKQHLKLKHFDEHTPLTQPLDQQKVLVEPLSQI